MGKYIDKGNDGFASIRNSNFVDKSLLITQVNSMRFSNDMHRIECKDDVWIPQL